MGRKAMFLNMRKSSNNNGKFSHLQKFMLTIESSCRCSKLYTTAATSVILEIGLNIVCCVLLIEVNKEIVLK